MPPPTIPPPKLPQPTGKDTAAGLGCLLILVMIVGLPIWAYNWLNDNDWIPHSETIDIHFKGDWLQGESRTCSGVLAAQTNLSWKLADLYCPETADGTTPHTISIKFFGKTDRPGVAYAYILDPTKNQWRCVRTADSFTCYALN